MYPVLVQTDLKFFLKIFFIYSFCVPDRTAAINMAAKRQGLVKYYPMTKTIILYTYAITWNWEKNSPFKLGFVKW